MYHIADTELEMELLPLIVLLLFAGRKKRPVGRKDVGLSLCHCHTLSNLQPPLNIISSNILHGNNKVEIMLIVNYA